MTPEEIVRTAEQQGIQLVRFLYCANGGVIRGKSTHVGALARRITSGIGLVKGMQAFTSLDSLAPHATYGPAGPARHAPALRAADNQVTYRQTVRGVAAQHGMVASLAPKPWADQAGSGAHLHWSIWNADHSSNVLADSDPGAVGGLSELGRHAVGGL